MLIVMHKDATVGEIAAVTEKIAALGLTPHAIPGAQRIAIGITGNKEGLEPAQFSLMKGVTDVIRVSQPYKLVSREVKPDDTIVDIAGVKVGGGSFCVMAGPCSVETREQVMSTAEHVKKHGANLLRGGAYKPRTSPYEFQGLKLDGLKLLADARERTGLPVITEVKDTETLKQVAEYADAFQIGARNMQNFSLLEAVGETRKPVMLKRGPSSTLREWLMAAEYIVARGNNNVILCERGIRTFETATRNTLDLGVLPVLQEMTHLPIIVDPSHGTGKAVSVTPMARAAAATGVDGIMVEVHPDPPSALSDGPQALTFPMFEKLMREVRPIAELVGRAAERK